MIKEFSLFGTAQLRWHFYSSVEEPNITTPAILPNKSSIKPRFTKSQGMFENDPLKKHNPNDM